MKFDELLNRLSDTHSDNFQYQLIFKDIYRDNTFTLIIKLILSAIYILL